MRFKVVELLVLCKELFKKYTIAIEMIQQKHEVAREMLLRLRALEVWLKHTV